MLPRNVFPLVLLRDYRFPFPLWYIVEIGNRNTNSPRLRVLRLLGFLFHRSSFFFLFFFLSFGESVSRIDNLRDYSARRAAENSAPRDCKWKWADAGEVESIFSTTLDPLRGVLEERVQSAINIHFAACIKTLVAQKFWWKIQQATRVKINSKPLETTGNSRESSTLKQRNPVKFLAFWEMQNCSKNTCCKILTILYIIYCYNCWNVIKNSISVQLEGKKKKKRKRKKKIGKLEGNLAK